MATKSSWHLIVADTHGGSKLSLLPPDLVLIDEQNEPWVPALTKSQEAIHRVWTRLKENVIAISGRDPVYAYHDGDITHGNHYPDKELVSTRMSDHIEIAITNMAEILKMPRLKSLILIAGTGVHEFGQGSSTYVVERALQPLFPEKQVKAIGHAKVNGHGVIFDFAHHGPHPGKRNWTRGNELRLYIRSLMMDDIQSGNIPPDMIARAHFHQYARETVDIRAGGSTYTTRGVVLPSLSFLDDYARKAARSPGKVTVGGILVHVYDGKIHHIYDQEPDFMETFDLRKEVILDE